MKVFAFGVLYDKKVSPKLKGGLIAMVLLVGRSVLSCYPY